MSYGVLSDSSSPHFVEGKNITRVFTGVGTVINTIIEFLNHTNNVVFSSSDYFKGLIFSRVSPITGTLANGPSPSLLASSLPVLSLAPVKLAPDMSAIFTSASVILAPVTLSPCICRYHT